MRTPESATSEQQEQKKVFHGIEIGVQPDVGAMHPMARAIYDSLPEDGFFGRTDGDVLNVVNSADGVEVLIGNMSEQTEAILAAEAARTGDAASEPEVGQKSRKIVVGMGVAALGAPFAVVPSVAAAEVSASTVSAPRHFTEGVRHGEGGATDIVYTPDGNGMVVVYRSGEIAGIGATPAVGPKPSLREGETVSTVRWKLDEDNNVVGYWSITNKGRAIPFGAAERLPDFADVHLNAPIVSADVTPSQRGLWLLGADGGVFTTGDAEFHGSTGDIQLNSPVNGMVATPDGEGYYFVAGDGGVFTFGNAVFRGSLGDVQLNKPIVGMVEYGTGYLLFAEDGGIFDFSPDRDFLGSLGGDPSITRNNPVVRVAVQKDGRGYAAVLADGQIYAWGDSNVEAGGENPTHPDPGEQPEEPGADIEVMETAGPNPIRPEQVKVESCNAQAITSSYFMQTFAISVSGLRPSTNRLFTDGETYSAEIYRTLSDGTIQSGVLVATADMDGVGTFQTNVRTATQAEMNMLTFDHIIFTRDDGSATKISLAAPCVVNPSA